ncbi:hypothetical protein EVG20_g5245 [Dentipellis fragilis]|uniref:Uncharacterized protein n=1 Tax=Dentipellis fragilis TaxID=205917 RepID=A0A4Y9YW82_9AGAM|nr:hypothetical protein EVG20_g5245 [Dentipellis fragilis]
MGASQSKPDQDSDKIFYNETPIQFSHDLVNHLSDNLDSPDIPPQRQSSLDDHVRQRIQAELARLHEEEEAVQVQIENALARENLDRERGKSEATDTVDENAMSSAVLLGDMEQIKGNIDRFQTRHDLVELPLLQATSDAVAACYRANSTTTLDCWKQVSEFRNAVHQVEQVTYFA